jgi:hypothetical protein
MRAMRQAGMRDRRNGPRWRGRDGVTLAEVLTGASILLMAIVALMTTLIAQNKLNEHSRNVSWATNDATRVLEQLQMQNSEGICGTVDTAPPAGFASWDAWLADTTVNGGGGKSVPPLAAGELVVLNPPVGANPVQVSVTVCWRHRDRDIGECQWNGAQMVAADSNGDGIITSPATLSTRLTCRG